MPCFDVQCQACGSINEHLFRHWDDPPQPCDECGSTETVKMPGRFGVPLSGSLSKYMDLRREGAQMEGFYAYRKVSSVSGQPEPVWLSTMEEVRAFNKAEGLADPAEVPTNSTISADGKRIVSNGMPGQWVSGLPSIPARLQEILDKPEEEFKSPPATATPRMPADYGVKVEVVEAPAEVAG